MGSASGGPFTAGDHGQRHGECWGIPAIPVKLDFFKPKGHCCGCEYEYMKPLNIRQFMMIYDDNDMFILHMYIYIYIDIWLAVTGKCM